MKQSVIDEARAKWREAVRLLADRPYYKDQIAADNFFYTVVVPIWRSALHLGDVEPSKVMDMLDVTPSSFGLDEFTMLAAFQADHELALDAPSGRRVVRRGLLGGVWLLASREKGWGAFGFWFDSWDALFRTFDVRITGHGVDEHGPWWSAENMPTREAK